MDTQALRAATGQGESMIKTKHNFRTPEPWRQHTALRAAPAHEQHKTGLEHPARGYPRTERQGVGPGGAGAGRNDYIDPTCV